MYYCNFVNPPPVSKGEGPFPDSIVDDRDAEPISSLVARMLRGELPPRDRDLIFDSEDENVDPDNFPDTVYDPTDLGIVPRGTMPKEETLSDQPMDTQPADLPKETEKEKKE